MTDEAPATLHAIEEEAADWLLRLEDADAVLPEAERREFVAWLQRSPQHIEEFLQVSALQTELASANDATFPDVQTLIDQARLNVVDIVRTETAAPAPLKQRGVRLRRMLTAAAGIVVLAVMAQHFVVEPAGRGAITEPGHTYSTAVGEQRSVVLADGSVVNMNTRSTLNVRFTPTSRLVELMAGEAIFDVQKDADRPFLVKAGRSVVEAIGTRFNVYQQDKKTVVTVVEGHVSVSTRDAKPTKTVKSIKRNTKPAPAVRLQGGGQVAVLQSGDMSTPTSVDAKKATAWTERRLVFDAEPLQFVARELNRYNHRRLRIGDVRIATRSISGVFNAGDPETLLAFLKTVGDIRVESDPATGDWVLFLAGNDVIE